jgi:hypothetical protein
VLRSIVQARAEAVAFQVANSSRIVFRGSRPIPAFPAPHPGESPPPADAPDPEEILDQAPCAYKLTAEQYHGTRTDGPTGMVTTAAQRIAAHGWKVVPTPDGVIIPLSQPERGLVPLLLDAQAAEELVGAQRLAPTMTGDHDGPLTVTGFMCLAGASVSGPVRVEPGAVLIANRSTITGPVTATGAAGVFLTASEIQGPVRVSGTTGAVVVAANLLSGPVQLNGNTTAGGASLLTLNTIRGPLRCTGNTPEPVNLELLNAVTGPRTGQCASL